MSNQVYNSASQSYLDDQNRPKNKSRTVQVIGAGYPRTGTLSFTLAIQKLIKGPVCHGGSAILTREESFIEGWISILDPKPPNTSEAYTIHTLQTLLAGYVGVTDAPGIRFVGELCEAFPDAVVICTTRDPEKWWVSMEPVIKAVTPWWLPVVFASRPTLRYFSKWFAAMRVRGEVIYGPDFKADKKFLETHNEYVKRVTPPNRLHFFDVAEGWEPLCKILNVPVPDEPFPRVNDKDQLQEDIQGLVIKGVVGWLQIFGVVGAVVILMAYALK